MKKKVRKAYVETWWGEQLPDYIGMSVEIREISPVTWKKALSEECIRWAADRLKGGARILLFRFPVINKEDLDTIGLLIEKRMKARGFKIEARVLENGMIDIVKIGYKEPAAPREKKEKDRWSIFLKK